MGACGDVLSVYAITTYQVALNKAVCVVAAAVCDVGDDYFSPRRACWCLVLLTTAFHVCC